MTVRFPAFCPSCGFAFESNSIVIEGQVEGLTLSGNQDLCPRCGESAELPDGTFNVVEDTIHVLSASELTRDRLLQLKKILDRARAGDMSASAATTAIGHEAPGLRPLLDRYGPMMQKALIVFLWFVIQTLIQQGISDLRDDSASKQDVQDAVEKAVAQCQRGH